MKVAIRAGLWLLGVLVALLLVAQLIPYGRNHTNPPVLAEPLWGDPQAKATAVRACYDCHSNETRWPWYSNIAPVSWLVQRDVDAARNKLNFSEWGPGQRGSEIVGQVTEGEMPPGIYLLTHPDARLTTSQRDAFIQGLMATFGSAGEGLQYAFLCQPEDFCQKSESNP